MGSVASLINTMCLSSLCGRGFIRSSLFKMKSGPHVGMSLLEMDPGHMSVGVIVCGHVRVHGTCGGSAAIPDSVLYNIIHWIFSLRRG